MCISQGFHCKPVWPVYCLFLNGLNQFDLSITCSSAGLNQFNLSIIYSPAGSPGYGSDYEEEARFTPNGPVTSSQPPYNSPENELLKQQLIDHHRDSPRPPFTQPQMVQGTTVTLRIITGFHTHSLCRLLLTIRPARG